MTDEYHPELAEDDADDRGPVHSGARLRATRIVVMVGLVALILPGVLFTVSTQISTASAACALVVARDAPDSTGSSARFEFGGAEGPGWYCYAPQYGGSEVLLRSLGLIPGL